MVAENNTDSNQPISTKEEVEEDKKKNVSQPLSLGLQSVTTKKRTTLSKSTYFSQPMAVNSNLSPMNLIEIHFLATSIRHSFENYPKEGD
jgi:hypothetical protein